MSYFQNFRHTVFTRSMLPCLMFSGALFVLLLLYALRPISDPDFWWHLKTGDLMIRQNGFLQADPFNYTGDGIVRGFQAVTLHGYWLWQVIASLLFGAFGFAGIFSLKIATAVLLCGAVLFEQSRQRLSSFAMIVPAALGALAVINVYHLERPQVFSFFFATLLVGMISRIRRGLPPTPLLVPLMILWSNIHPGFVIGDIMLGLAAAGFLIQYRSDSRKQLFMTSWTAAGILASFINPNGWNVFISLFNFVQNRVEFFDVVEYRSSLQLFLLQSRSAALCLWALAAIHLAGLVLASRRFWAEVLISFFLIVIGLAYIRNAGFIAVSLLPMTGWYLEEGCARLRGRSFCCIRAAVNVVLVAVFSWVIIGELKAWRGSHGAIANRFPVTMADYLRRSGLSGPLFNDYNAGGYLDWALYPTGKTFIDGRNLDPAIASHYLKIASGSREPVAGKPFYQQLLDRYRVDIVALRIAFDDGRIQPLLKLLLKNPAWIPVYIDDQSFVMVRNTPGNTAVIQRDGLDRGSFLDMLTLIIANYVRSSPHATHLAVMYADILIYQGKLAESAQVLRKLENAQLNPALMSYLKDQYGLARADSF